MSYGIVAILYNPNSTGPSKDMAKDVRKRLRERLKGQKIELIPTRHVGHAEKLAYSIAKRTKNPLIVSSSGDGGYNEVVNGAMRAQKEGFSITAAVLPAGNANDHYQNLHTGDIVEQIVRGRPRKIDVLKLSGTHGGRAMERYAHSYIGIGLTPKVGKKLNQTKLHFFNEWWVVARALLTVKAVRLRIDKILGRYESVVFSNVNQMSKYLKVSRASSVTDGVFEVTVFRKRSKLRLIAILVRASFIGVVEDYRAKRFELETVDTTLVQTDGEVITLDGGTKVVVEIEAKALSCFV